MTDPKSLATLQAEAALAGYELQPDPQGGFYVQRWGHIALFDTLEEVRAWLAKVTGGKVAA